MMKISIIKGDITKIKADAIVNAANSSLLGGDGVDSAIHKAAGPALIEECKKIQKEIFPNGLPTGEAVATKAYKLKAKIIIHTVGPVFGKDDISLLKNCYSNCLKIAEQNNCKKIAFPAISAGAYGISIEISAKTAKSALEEFKSSNLKEIVLVLFSQKDLEAYKREFNPKTN